MSVDRFGLECEWRQGDKLVRAAVRDLSHTGFFIETETALEPGQEFSLRLVGGTLRRPVYIRGIVESCLSQGTSDAGSPPRVWFQLLCFSPEYGLLITGADPTPHESDPEEVSARHTRGEDEREWLSQMLRSEGESSPLKVSREEGWANWEEQEPLFERAGVPLFNDDYLAPQVIVIDDGELDDVVRVLEKLGVKAKRQSPDREFTLTSWIRPRDLLIVTAKQALKLRLPLRNERQGFVSIVIADSDARTLCSALRRFGYQYVISRPIHPMAMSMLLSQAIFSHNDQRTVPRGVLGYPVTWSCGWGRRRPGVILDLSPSGCRLLIRDASLPDSAIKIRVPGAMANVRNFTLVGQIVRSTRASGGRTLGVSFNDLPARVREKLQQVLALPGPCRLTGEPLSLGDAATPSAISDAPGDPPPRDRRHKFRAVLKKEVAALEHDSSRIKHVLVSSDLSIDGMRVEAHPSLAIGEHLDLALYEDSKRDPLVIAAVVARDDGRRGWWLRFVGVTPKVRERLTQALDRFPPVTRLEDPDPESGRVVLGQVLLQRKRRDDDELT